MQFSRLTLIYTDS